MPHIGQRLSFNTHPCTVRYVGPVDGTAGQWIGVEWDDPTRGKHNGIYAGKRYFTCKFPHPLVRKLSSDCNDTPFLLRVTTRDNTVR